MSVPFRYFNGSPEVIRLVVMMYVKYPLSLRNVEDLLAERGIDISHETVRFWWNRFGPMFAAQIRKKRVAHTRHYPQRRWHLDEVFVKVNGKLCYLWRAVDHEGEVLEAVVTVKRDKAAALKFFKRIMKRYGRPRKIVTDGLCSYCAATKEIGNADRHEVGRRLNNRAENSHQRFRRERLCCVIATGALSPSSARGVAANGNCTWRLYRETGQQLHSPQPVFARPLRRQTLIVPDGRGTSANPSAPGCALSGFWRTITALSAPRIVGEQSAQRQGFTVS
jgi:putative transposase